MEMAGLGLDKLLAPIFDMHHALMLAQKKTAGVEAAERKADEKADAHVVAALAASGVTDQLATLANQLQEAQKLARTMETDHTTILQEVNEEIATLRDSLCGSQGLGPRQAGERDSMGHTPNERGQSGERGQRHCLSLELGRYDSGCCPSFSQHHHTTASLADRMGYGPPPCPSGE